MSAHGRISSWEEDRERGRQIDILIAQRNQHPPSRSPQLSIQDRIQNRIVTLHILDEERISKTQCAFQILTECIIEEAVFSMAQNIGLKMNKRNRFNLAEMNELVKTVK